LGYLVQDREDLAVPFVRSLSDGGKAFLWITSRAIDAAPEGGDLLRITSLRGGVATADPRRLQDLRFAATTFFDERGPGILVVDCLDSVILHAGIERAVRFVDDLNEETAMRNGVLVVFVDPRSMNPRMIAWLERELDPLPQDATPAGVIDRLAV